MKKKDYLSALQSLRGYADKKNEDLFGENIICNEESTDEYKVDEIVEEADGDFDDLAHVEEISWIVDSVRLADKKFAKKLDKRMQEEEKELGRRTKKANQRARAKYCIPAIILVLAIAAVFIPNDSNNKINTNVVDTAIAEQSTQTIEQTEIKQVSKPQVNFNPVIETETKNESNNLEPETKTQVSDVAKPQEEQKSKEEQKPKEGKPVTTQTNVSGNSAETNVIEKNNIVPQPAAELVQPETDSSKKDSNQGKTENQQPRVTTHKIDFSKFKSNSPNGKQMPTDDDEFGQVFVPIYGGKKYHYESTCSQMIDPLCLTIDHAEALGFEPCARCIKF